MFDESAERQAILDLCQSMQDAWNRGDVVGYAAQFTDDASFVAWNGLHGYGRQAIEDAHRPLLAGPLAGSQLVVVDDDEESGLPESVRFIRPDVAIMVSSGGAVTLAEQTEPGRDHAAVQTFVLIKNAGRWRITAFHNTRRQEQS